MGLKSTALKRRTQRHAAGSARERITKLGRRPARDSTPQPKSRPLFWFRLGIGPGWHHDDLDSPSRPGKGALSLPTRARRLLWSWWPWALVSIWRIAEQDWGWAIGAGSFALIAYLVQPAALPPRFGLDHQFAVDSDEFLSTMAGISGTPFVDGNVLEVLNNGNEFYPRMLEAIEGARRSITIEAYIYWAGEVGLLFARALAERAQAGVPVKILLDAIGSHTIGREILDTLDGGGCHVAWYNPIHWYTLGRFNNRTHRKSLIVDGDVAFTGGAGIADQWLGCAQDRDHWRDIQVRLEGPAVVPLQTGFAYNWQKTTGELLSGHVYYPPISSRGRMRAQTIMSSPENGGSIIRTMYYLSIVCARTSILIANPYFVPDPVAIDTLIDAKQRGIDVRIMVSGIRNDNWLARHNSERLFGRLLDAGIEILEYNRTMLHHKTMVVDGVWVTVGTTNFDNRSFAHNEESNVCVYDRAVAQQLEWIFEEDAEACARVKPAAWHHRGLWARVQEFIASFLEEQA
jgi:cardiolipin synthase A/B